MSAVSDISDPTKIEGREERNSTLLYKPNPPSKDILEEAARLGYTLTELNPDQHGEVISIVEELAPKLRSGMPKGIFVAHGKPQLLAQMSPYTGEIMISQAILDSLNSEELRFIIGHELRHFRHHIDRKLPTRISWILMCGYGESVVNWLERNNLPGDKFARTLFDRFIDAESKKVDNLEREADIAGSCVSSPDAAIGALTKIYARHIQIEFEDLKLIPEDELSEIFDEDDRLLRSRVHPLHKIILGKRTFIDRMADIKQASCLPTRG